MAAHGETTRTALVTGASSGIGQASAVALRDAGFRVIGTSRNPATLSADQRIDGVEWMALDLESRDSIRALAEAAGPTDVLINTAGESPSGPHEGPPPAALERLFPGNAAGPGTPT